jgi:hypothetical protein
MIGAQLEQTGGKPREDQQAGDKREDARFSACRRVEVTVLQTRAAPMEACTLNISKRGLRLRVDQPLPPGTLIKADSREIRMHGEVLRCIPVEGAYHLGVRLFRSLTAASDPQMVQEDLLAYTR